MTQIVDGIRSELKRDAIVEFICPQCHQSLVQPVRKTDDEGSLVGMMPHDGCESVEVLIRVR